MKSSWAVLGLSFALAMSAACKSENKALQRVIRSVESREFWPSAPKIKAATGKRALKYATENMQGYHFRCDTATTGTELVSTKVLVGVMFQSGEAPGERKAMLRLLDQDVRASSAIRIRISLEDEVLSMNLGGGDLELKRGDDSALSLGELGTFDIEAVLDQPLLIFSPVLGAGESSLLKSHPKHPLKDLVTSFLLNAFVLFPSLPAEPIAVGHKWSTKSSMAVGASQTPIEVVHTFEYAGDAECPSGGSSCAVLKLTASSDRVAVDSVGLSGHVTYGFAGRLYFDAEKGVVDESRLRMEADIEYKSTTMSMRGTFTVRPTTSHM